MEKEGEGEREGKERGERGRDRKAEGKGAKEAKAARGHSEAQQRVPGAAAPPTGPANPSERVLQRERHWGV